MGYLVSLSALKGDRLSPKTEALHQLEKSLPWRLYRAKSIDALLLDCFNDKHSSKAEAFPFCSIPAVKDLPLHFEAPLTELNALYEELRKKNRADNFKRAFVNFNLRVSRLVETEVLSVLSDDEGLDLSCLSINGNLQKLRFRAGGVEVIWAEGQSTTQVKNKSSLIHRIASQEAASFFDLELPLFGFDGDAKLLNLEVIDMSPPLPPPPPTPPRGGWAAHEQKQRELVRAQRKWWQFWK